MTIVVASFYHFFDFPNFEEKRFALLDFLKARDIKGSILIAHEGINGTVGGSREAIDEMLEYIESVIIGGKFEHKESFSEKHPFIRTKVRLKREIIPLGRPNDPFKTGVHLNSREWDALISDPDTVILDSRNSYETHLGTFKGAIIPNIQNFKQLPDFVDMNLLDKKKAKIATFCTGGIRCERFAAWMLDQGFEQVYHLKGGILKYLEETPAEKSNWQGECYVFDKRVAVGHGLVPTTTASMCNACGHALLPEDRAQPCFDEHVTCPYCVDKNKESVAQLS
jgi:UPF0176 protein